MYIGGVCVSGDWLICYHECGASERGLFVLDTGGGGASLGIPEG